MCEYVIVYVGGLSVWIVFAIENGGGVLKIPNPIWLVAKRGGMCAHV
jgi:hypothetical protein